jgi:hypothetical protein
VIDLAKANRQMIAERSALLAERDRALTMLKQIAVDTSVRVVEGLGVLLEKEAAGDPAAKLVLSQLAERLESVRALQSRLVVVRNGGQSGG